MPAFLKSPFVKFYLGPILIGLVALIVALRFVDPAPPKSIVFAAGQPGGAYHRTAIEYQDRLSEYDVEVIVLETAGSLDNLERLRIDGADVALVQGGLANAEDVGSLRALGSVFLEPVWVFVRDDVEADDFGDLRNLRMAIGLEGSGTRAMAQRLQLEWGGRWPEQSALALSSRDALLALKAGEIDAALFVAAPEADYVAELLSSPAFRLMPFARAPALSRRMPFLAEAPLLAGVVDIGRGIPAQDVPLVASAAALVVDSDTHPAIQAILLEAASEIQRPGTLMSAPATFPSANYLDLPLSDEAARYYEEGPSFLRRVFPFGVANFLERAWVLAIPLLTLMIPLVRIAPPLYRWRVRRKIYVWYSALRELEHRGRHAEDEAERREVIARLSDIQAETGRIEVPLSYTDDLYRLRNHIAFVLGLVTASGSKRAEGDERATA